MCNSTALFRSSYCLLILVLCGGNARSVNVTEYFPEIGDDLGKVTWAHAVNSKALLEEALNGDIMMLEADVSLGVVRPNTLADADLIPIMAHPPAVTSDLSLQEFLLRFVESAEQNGTRKGIKLDFKSIDVLEPALDELAAISHRISAPVWLNADILRGPVESTGNPVNASEFLTQVKTRFPGSTLSTGWTTRFGPQNDGTNITEGSYTPLQIKEMMDTLRTEEVNQEITFPVRAGIAAHSTTELMDLIAGTRPSTLTLWGSESDPVDVPALREMLDTIGRDKVYIDVPKDLRDALNTANCISAPALVLLSTVAALAR